MKPLKLIGQRFGRLLVISQEESYKGTRWRCKCECGKIIVARGCNLNSGSTKSCGCLNIEQAIKTNTKHGHKPSGKHGKASGTYESWRGMFRRCYKENYHLYKDYGGRGIKVCDRWKSFENFLSDMGERPKGYSIDRVNNNGNYEPRNCRWANRKQQNRNTRVQKKPMNGVYAKKPGVFIASISGKLIGKFDNPVDAIKARKSAETEEWRAGQ